MGEQLWLEYLRQEGYPEPQRLQPGPDKTPDFELSTSEGPVVCEVKHFPWTEDDDAAVRSGVVLVGPPGFGRLRDAIRRGKQQLRGHRGKITCIVVCNTNPLVDTGDWAVYEAMFGRLSMHFVVDLQGRTEPTYLGTAPSGYGRIVHPEHPAPWVSAVAVLERHAPDRRRFEDLCSERAFAGLTQAELAKMELSEFCRRLEEAAEAVRREHPELDPSREVLRLRVYENPEAERPLPRTILAGRFDVRHGLLGDGTYGQLPADG
ncbi:MAG: hypothetical protein QN143_05995 [Armatimonadota bacterium]|nr:hypothetical protein [Armatimonadota bacterium]